MRRWRSCARSCCRPVRPPIRSNALRGQSGRDRSWESSCTSRRGTRARSAPYNVTERHRTARWARRARRARWRARPATIPPTGGADRRSQPNATSLGASYTAPQRADGDQRRLLAAVAVLGRARRFALEPGAGAARGHRRVRRQPARRSRTSSSTTTRPNSRRCSARIASRQLATCRTRDAGDDPARSVHAGRRDRAVQRRIRLPDRRRQAAREPRLRELRQGDRRLRAAAGQHQLRAVAVRSVHGGRRGGDVAGRDSRRAAVHRPRRMRRVPPRTDVHGLRLPQHRRAPDGPVRAGDRRRPLRRHRRLDDDRSNVVSSTASSEFSDDQDTDVTSLRAADRRLPTRRRGSSRRRRCATSARPPPTCTTAPTRRCGTS